MCKYCREYGGETKWYLNPANYTEEARSQPRVKDSRMIEVLGGQEKMDFEIGAALMADMMIPDVENQENLKEMEKLVEENHGGQVIPLEDAVKAVELAEGHECVLVPCYCRQYTGGIERMTCLWFYPVTRLVAESRQWEKHLLLSKEEAIEHLQQFDREGMVHLIEWGPVPIPLVICNCQWPYCWALRARLNYNVRNQPLKGEYLATVNPDSCDGCEGRPPCLARCQFGALRYIPEDEKVLVNLSQCFGCGVCRTSCPHQAISLLEKENVPGLKELW